MIHSAEDLYENQSDDEELNEDIDEKKNKIAKENKSKTHGTTNAINKSVYKEAQVSDDSSSGGVFGDVSGFGQGNENSNHPDVTFCDNLISGIIRKCWA